MAKQESLLAGAAFQSILARIRILRLWAAFALAAAVVLSFLSAQEGNVDWESLAIAVAVVLLVGTAVYPLNDVYDLEVDKKAHPNRPIVRGEITTRQAQIQAYVMIVGGGHSILLSGHRWSRSCHDCGGISDRVLLGKEEIGSGGKRTDQCLVQRCSDVWYRYEPTSRAACDHRPRRRPALTASVFTRNREGHSGYGLRWGLGKKDSPD